MSVLIFLAGTCSISWLFINYCEWRLLGFPRHASLRDRPWKSLDFRWCLGMDLFQRCKIKKKPFELLEDHHDIKFVSFYLQPQFTQIMLSAKLCTLTIFMAECHLHMHSGEYRRWHNAAYLSGCSGNALHELLNYLEAIKNRLYIFLLSIMLENSLILCLYCACPSDGIGSKFHVYTLLSVSRGCLKRRNSCALNYFGVLHLVLSRRKLSCKQFSSQNSLATFTTHSSSVDWCLMMA